MQEGRTIASFDFVEREPHLERFDRLISAADSGEGGAVIVEGRPGVGKSALLDLAATRAERTGMLVLRARGLELEQDLPFGGAMRLFEPVAKRASAQQEWPFVGAAAAAWSLFDWSGARPWQREEMATLVYGLYWLSSNLAEQEPIALIIDDAQWADTPSLRFLLYLAHRLRELPIALVIARRPAGREPQHATIEQITSVAGGRLLPVEPISSVACEQLVLRYLPGAEQGFAAACAHLTRWQSPVPARCARGVGGKGGRRRRCASRGGARLRSREHLPHAPVAA